MRTLRTLLLLPIALASGCSYYQAYSACELNRTHKYPLTHEAVRALPCGPDPIEYGYRTTNWSQWPGQPRAAACPECVPQDLPLSPPLVAPGNAVEPEPLATEPPAQLPEPIPTEPPTQVPQPTPTEPPAQVPEPTPTEPPSVKPEPSETPRRNGVASGMPSTEVSLTAAVEHQPAVPVGESATAALSWRPDNSRELVIPVIVDDEHRAPATSGKDRRDRIGAKAVASAAKESQAQRKKTTKMQTKPQPRHPAANAPPSPSRSLKMRHYAPRRHAIELR